jgi:hypothetical protein
MALSFDAGVMGDPRYALAYRALAEMDLLYGSVGVEIPGIDVHPVFAWGTSAGLRAFGHDMPRQGIQDVCVECYPWLVHVDRVVIEGRASPASIFGLGARTTQAVSRVTLNNSTGFFNSLIVREVVSYSPAALYFDADHQHTGSVLGGVVSGVRFHEHFVTVTYGHAPLRQNIRV